MLDKAQSLALRFFTLIRMFSFKRNCMRSTSPDPSYSVELSGQSSCPVAFHVRFFHKPPGTIFPTCTYRSFHFHRTQAVTVTDENRRKRIIWRACHRGIKEMDIVVGTFVQARIANSDEAELQELERIIEIPDQDLLAWLTGAQPVPGDQQSALLQEMLASRFDETFFGNPE
jgi:antitoxin CptB